MLVRPGQSLCTCRLCTFGLFSDSRRLSGQAGNNSELTKGARNHAALAIYSGGVSRTSTRKGSTLSLSISTTDLARNIRKVNRDELHDEFRQVDRVCATPRGRVANDYLCKIIAECPLQEGVPALESEEILAMALWNESNRMVAYRRGQCSSCCDYQFPSEGFGVRTRELARSICSASRISDGSW